MDERRILLAQFHSALRAYAAQRQEEEQIRRRVQLEEKIRQETRTERARRLFVELALFFIMVGAAVNAYNLFKDGKYVYAAASALIAILAIAANKPRNQ